MTRLLSSLPVGSKVRISVNSNEKWIVLSHSHFGDGKTLLFRERYIEDASLMAFSGNNLNYWASSRVRNYLRTDFLNSLPIDFRNIIKEVTVYTENQVSTENIFLLSAVELGFQSDGGLIGGNHGNRIDGINNYRAGGFEYFTRSPQYKTTDKVRYINHNGGSGSIDVNSSCFVRPAVNVSSNAVVSDTTDDDGYYAMIWNQPPTISGQDQDLGDKNQGFVMAYQINDVDTGDNLVVTEKLNGVIIKTINGAPRNENLEIEITNETLFSLPLNSTNTIEIKVDDQNGGIAYRRFTFRRTNTAPIISGNDEDLGQKMEPFGIDFSVSDNEGNAITVKTYLDGVLKEEYQAEDGATNTFTISQEDWFKLNIGQHSIKIEATDEHGATAVRNYTFTRFDDKIQFTLKTPIETDIMATKLLVTPTWTIPAGAVAKIEACNNGFDEVPAWEDITSQVNISRHYNFTNDTKTAEKWGINIRFTVEKGTATEQAIVNGFGGAFE